MTAKPTAKQIRDSVEAPTMWGTPTEAPATAAVPQPVKQAAA